MTDKPRRERAKEPAPDLPELPEDVHAELRALAGSYFRRESPGHTLQPTALVHEAWLRLAQAEPVSWNDRAHFLSTVARVMRRLLVDHARRRATERRGGEADRVAIEVDEVPAPGGTADLLELDELLERLAEVRPDHARLAVQRIFGGMTHAEIAEREQLSERTVERRWRAARAWLASEWSGGLGG